MRLLAWFAGLMALILGTWMIWGGGFEASFTMHALVARLNGAGSYAWAYGWGLLISDVVLPVPGTVVMSALGWIYGFVLGGLIAGMGSFLAGMTAYGLGRMMGERAARALLGDRDFEEGRLLFAKGGGWFVCLSRALPLLPEAVACTAGLVRMPLGRFMGALACGSLPMGLVFAWIGASGRDAPGFAIGLSLILPALLWLVSRLLTQRWQRSLTPPHD